jgi:hypothetical protein
MNPTLLPYLLLFNIFDEEPKKIFTSLIATAL